MAQVTITLEDSDDGLVIQTVSYGDKFEVGSNAHQFAGMMLKLAADEVAKQNAQDDSVVDAMRVQVNGYNELKADMRASGIIIP